MSPYADTSFVGALFGVNGDAKYRSAWKWWNEYEEVPILISKLTKLEYSAIIHQEFCGGRMNAKEVKDARRRIEVAFSQGVFLLRRAMPDRVFPVAHRLIDHFSEGFACKSLDILQVATAHMLDADTFLSFDGNQRTLANSLNQQTNSLTVPDL